jgi:hypothetical protein
MVRALPPTLILNGLTRSPFLGHLESIDWCRRKGYIFLEWQQL